MRPIEWNSICRKDWLKNLPDVIYKLSNEYGFYYNGIYNHIKSIDDTLAKNETKGTRSRINLYVADTKENLPAMWYLVIYTKRYIKVYKCNEYKRNENYANIKRFVKKFTNAYKKGKEERFDREISDAQN